MHLENPAHFHSFTKTGGLENAPRMTHQQSAPGVQLEHDLKMTSGDIVQLHVSENMQLSVWNCAYVMKELGIYVSAFSVSEQPPISGSKTLQQEHITSSTCSRCWLGFRLKKAANNRVPPCLVSQIHTSRPLSQVGFHLDTYSLKNSSVQQNIDNVIINKTTKTKTKEKFWSSIFIVSFWHIMH